MQATHWPTDDELRQLLDGSLTTARHAEIEALLESDDALRQRLEQIAGGSSWIGRAGPPSGSDANEPHSDAALLAAIGGLKAQASAATMSSDTHRPHMALNFLAPSDQSDSLGRLGHYEVLELVGSGGFGMVLKAHDPKLKRIVAIKVLSPGLAVHATPRQRFLREAQQGAYVKHEGVVTIHDINSEHQPPFIVMEYIAGMSLQQMIDREGPLPVAKILRIASQAAEGLAAAHKKGLIHRDIKPANILLENGVQRVKITDFGLARAVDEASLTQSGVIAGTPQYMAPEQARGESVDYRSDLFSLGSVIYTMCAGRPAFRADSAVAVLKRVCEDAPRPIREVNPEIPAWLAGIVTKLMAKAPNDRFSSAAEVAELLNQCLAHVQQPSLVSLPEAAARLEPATGRASRAPVPVVPDDQLEEARNQLSLPGLGLILAGVVNLVVMLFFWPWFVGQAIDSATVIGSALWIVGSLIIIGSGVAVRSLQVRVMIYVGLVLAMVMAPGMILGLPAAVWAFIVLARPNVRAAIRHVVEGGNVASDSEPLSEIQSIVAPPAIAMRLVGMLNLAMAAVAMLLAGIMTARIGGGDARPLFFLAYAVFCGTGAIFIVAGAYDMQRLQRSARAVGAALACMVLIPVSLIGFPIGLWALLILLRPDVRRGFALAAGKQLPLASKPPVDKHLAPHAPPRRQSQAALVAIVLTLVLAMFCFVPLLLVGGYFFTSVDRPQMATGVETYSSGVYPAETSNGMLYIIANMPGLDVVLTSLDNRHLGPQRQQWRSEDYQSMSEGKRWDLPAGRYSVTARTRKGEEIYRRDVTVTAAQSEVVHVVRQVASQAPVALTSKDGTLDATDIRSVALAADGSHVAVGLKQGKILIADRTGKEIARLEKVRSHTCALSSDGRFLAAVGTDDKRPGRADDGIVVFEVATGKQRVLHPDGKHSDGRFMILGDVRALAFSPDGKTIVASSAYYWTKDKEQDSDHQSVILRWNLETDEELAPLQMQDGVIERLAFPATKNDLLVAISNSQLPRSTTITLWGLTDQKVLGRIWDLDRGSEAMAISPQGGWVYQAYAMYDGRDENDTYRHLRTFVTRSPGNADPELERGLWEKSHIDLDARTHAIAISPNGQLLALGKDPQRIELFQASSPDKLVRRGELTGADYGNYLSIAFTPDSRELVIASDKGELRHWDLTAWTPAGGAVKETAVDTDPFNAIGALQKIALLANDDLGRARERFKNGTATQVEVDDAEVAYLEAQVEFAIAMKKQSEVIELLTRLVAVRRQQIDRADELFKTGTIPVEQTNAARAAALKAEFRLRQAKGEAESEK